MEQEKIRTLNDYYIDHVDKLYRMYTGVATTLDAAEGDTMFLTISIPPGWNKDHDETAKKMAVSIRNCLPPLRSITRFHATFRRVSHPLGFVVSPTGASIKQLAGILSQPAGITTDPGVCIISEGDIPPASSSDSLRK